ncbi:MAG: twin-arginine translocation signal domain-containing protein, partial [Cyanobacteria bacterium CAN_BIN43]|nr:twin-arginine translocation signal domain-containing protein [Cyanobacteria bacterium CAN_BIN43]
MIDKRVLSRRQILQWSGLSGASLLLGGCATSLFSEQVGQAFEPLNHNLQA